MKQSRLTGKQSRKPVLELSSRIGKTPKELIRVIPIQDKKKLYHFLRSYITDKNKQNFNAHQDIRKKETNVIKGMI